MTILYDDTYTGARFTYGCTHRPPAYACVPDGRIVQGDRPHPKYPFGTITYPRQLTDAECHTWELTPLSDSDPHRAEAQKLWIELLKTDSDFADILLFTQWGYRKTDPGVAIARLGIIDPIYDEIPSYPARLRAIQELIAYLDEARTVSHPVSTNVLGENND